MAGGGDIILIPEIAYRMERVFEVVEDRARRGKRFSIIVVAEGVRLPGGEYVIRQEVADTHHKMRLGGIGVWMAHEIDAATATESRAVVLGHMQRGGTPTACDRVLATQFGHAALVEAMEGHTDVMVGRKGTRIVPVPLSHVANRQRLVEPDSQIVRAARAVGTSFGDE